MQWRKEHAVLFVTVIVLGMLARGRLTKTSLRGSRRVGVSPELAAHPIPDLAECLPGEGIKRGNFARDLFRAPRDTSPLPFLALVMPPLETLETLAPPTAFGPGPAAYNLFLRRPLEERAPVAGLFELSQSTSDEFVGIDFEEPKTPEPARSPEVDAERARAERFAALGYTVDTAETNTEPEFDSTLTSEERAERTAAYKRLYDWVYVGSLKFGHIQNEDRYALEARPEDSILFAEVDPSTGLARFGAQAAIEYDRNRVSEFGFADTPANAIELERRRFGATLRPAELDSALGFADRCVMIRSEAPRALEVAEEIYTLAIEVAQGDPRPELGLAACYEAGFRFEEAFAIYEKLIAAGDDKDALVLARRADLLARLRLFDRAEAGYREALRFGRTDWQALWRYGRFLRERGRIDEALDILARACKYEPTTSETKTLRAGLRTDHAWAQLEGGDPAQARDWFQRALAADSGFGLASAGLVCAQLYVSDSDGSANDVLGAELEGAGFDLLLALGMTKLETQDWASAKANLELAVDADPFRAFQAWRALSWLAESTGYPEEALAYAELAFANAPDDPYTLYQRGRLLVAADDLEEAERNFKAALDRELDMVDALVGLGELARIQGQHEAAERYFERALSLEPARAVVHSRRGLNLLQLGEEQRAEDSFREALRLDTELASAANGLAWCVYLSGDSVEATTQFADLVERRRNEPDADAAKVYAEDQIRRINDNESKEIWSDRFERRAGERIGKGWLKEEPHGLVISLQDGALQLRGQARSEGRTRIYQEISAGRFVSFEANVRIASSTRARVGIFLSRELRRRGDWETQAAVSVSREKEGAAQVRNIAQGERDAPYEDLFTTAWNTERVMPVKIELVGEGSEARATLFVDGLPVLEDVRVPRLGSATSNLRFGVFVEAETGRSADVVVDDVSVVRKIN